MARRAGIMEEPFERTIVLEDMIIRGENIEERISQMTKNMIAPAADLAMDGLQIPAVTMTDVKHCGLALRAKMLLNEAAYFRHPRCPNL